MYGRKLRDEEIPSLPRDVQDTSIISYKQLCASDRMNEMQLEVILLFAEKGPMTANEANMYFRKKYSIVGQCHWHKTISTLKRKYENVFEVLKNRRRDKYTGCWAQDLRWMGQLPRRKTGPSAAEELRMYIEKLQIENEELENEVIRLKKKVTFRGKMIKSLHKKRNIGLLEAK